MTETFCILKDAPTVRWPRRAVAGTQFNADPVRPSPAPQKNQLNTKRQLLNRLSDRFIASGFPGADLAVEYLYAKYMSKVLTAILAETPFVQNLKQQDYTEIILNGCGSLAERFSQIDAHLVYKVFEPQLDEYAVHSIFVQLRFKDR